MCEWNIRTILNDLVLALIINTSATLLAGAPMVAHTWYTYTCVAFATNIVAQLIVPTGTIAEALTNPLGDAPWRIYVQIFIENLIFVTIISLTEAFVQTGGPGMLAAWWQTYIWLMLIGYVTSVILFHVWQAADNR